MSWSTVSYTCKNPLNPMTALNMVISTSIPENFYVWGLGVLKYKNNT